MHLKVSPCYCFNIKAQFLSVSVLILVLNVIKYSLTHNWFVSTVAKSVASSEESIYILSSV